MRVVNKEEEECSFVKVNMCLVVAASFSPGTNEESMKQKERGASLGKQNEKTSVIMNRGRVCCTARFYLRSAGIEWYCGGSSSGASCVPSSSSSGFST